MDPIRRWFDETISKGRACQPSPTCFPLESTVVADAAAPAAALEAARFYRDVIGDCGDAWIHRQAIGGTDVFFVHLGTDGDESAIEVFDALGAHLGSAFLVGDSVTWEATDAVRARFVFET